METKLHLLPDLEMLEISHSRRGKNMNDKVKDVSLSFITNIDEELKLLEELITTFSNVVHPGDFLEKLPEYRTMIERLDSKISVNKNNITYLTSEYKSRINQVKAILSQYQTQLKDRICSNDQMNTNVTFYDEENLLSKSGYRDYEKEPAMYSMLAIVKRILNDEPDNIESIEMLLNDMTSLYKWYIDAQTFMLRVKCLLNDQNFIKRFATEYMSAEGETTLRELSGYFHRIRIVLKDARKQVTKIFQMFNAQESDYEIYQTVVNRFNQKALESYFCVGSVTSGIF